MNVEEALKYLGGGVVVYLLAAACSGANRPHSDGSSAGGAGGRPSGEGGELVAESGRGLGVAGIVDSMMNPVPDANAQDPSCGSCTVDGPVTIEGDVKIAQPVKMVTADTDPEQRLGGYDNGDEAVKVADGPLFLTDVRVRGASFSPNIARVFTTNSADCTGAPTDFDFSLSQGDSTYSRGDMNSIHGARLFIPAGSILCINAGFSMLTWSGFRPY